uniref:Putative kunitz-like peptide n=1 Tax=Rhipicephalus pulchellus TaxID=72859 RepID=L7MBY7_RHIPC
MIRFLIVVAVPSALITFLLIGQISGNGFEENCPNTTCKTPDEPFCHDIGSDNVTILYIYNETSHLCVNALIERGRNNTFESFFTCVSTCQTGQGALNCIGKPMNVYNNSKTTSSPALTLENQSETKDEETDDPYRFLEEPYEAYFYNVTAMKCQNYTAVGVAYNATNFFHFNKTCQNDCVGFNISTIYGNNKTN